MSALSGSVGNGLAKKTRYEAILTRYGRVAVRIFAIF